MKPDRVLRKLQSAPEDRKRWKSVARDLGDELPRARAETLQAFRAKLGDLSPSDPYLRGFLDALGEVGLAAQLRIEREDDRRALDALLARRHWPKLIALLEEGPQTVGAIAEKLEVDASAASRLMSEARALDIAQLVTDGSDGRSKLHALGPRGARLAAEAGNRGALTPSIKAQLDLAVHVLATACVEKQVSELWLTGVAAATPMAGIDAVACAQYVIRRALEVGLLVQRGAVTDTSELELPANLRPQLEAWAHTRSPPRFWNELARDLPREGKVVVRARRDTYDLWKRVKALTGAPVHAIALVDVDSKEDPNIRAPYVVAYEGADVLRYDRSQRARFTKLLSDGASGRKYLATSEDPEMTRAGFSFVSVSQAAEVRP